MTNTDISVVARRRFDEIINNHERLTRAQCAELDTNDPLSDYRRHYCIPDATLYFNGHELGPPSFQIDDRVRSTVQKEWLDSIADPMLNRAHDASSDRITAGIGRLMGVPSNSLALVNRIENALSAIVRKVLSRRPDRRTICYMDECPEWIGDAFEQLKQSHPDVEFIRIDHSSIVEQLSDRVAAVICCDINRSTGEKAALCEIANFTSRVDAWLICDVSLTIGTAPLDPPNHHFDIAIGDSERFLGGGPGAPGFVYVDQRLRSLALPTTTDSNETACEWKPLEEDWLESSERCRPLKVSSLGLTGLDASLMILNGLDLYLAREKSNQLSRLFIRLLGQLSLDDKLKLISPVDEKRRGNLLVFQHERSQALFRALGEDRVVASCDESSLITFGFSPIYHRYQDIWNAIERLSRLLKDERWRQPRFQ